MSWLTRKSVFDQFGATKHTPDRSNGHQNLLGRVVVVADATTAVGSGIVQELLREGAVVVAPVASEGCVEALLADCAGCPTETLLPVVADLSSEEACAALFEDVNREHGGAVDHAVGVFGTLWSGGMLTEQSAGELQRLLDRTALQHFRFAKAALPALKPARSASMLFISDGAGKRLLSPETSLHTVASAAVYGVILAAQDQYADAPQRVNEMRVYARVRRHQELADKNYQESRSGGARAYSNRKIGRLVVESLLASKHKERVVVTSTTLDGATVTV